jgi:hypothetical protein
MSSTIIQKEDVSTYNHISLFIPIKDTAFSCTITSSFFYMHQTLQVRADQIGWGQRHLTSAGATAVPLPPYASIPIISLCSASQSNPVG